MYNLAFAFSFLYVTSLFLVQCVSQNENIAKEIRQTLRKADSYIPNTQNTELLGIDLEQKGENYGTFDFIIAGSGTSGSVLVNRLTEIQNLTVLFLEAGIGMDGDVVKTSYYADLFSLSPYTWGYLTSPQKNGCLASKNRQCAFNTGKTLGGNTNTAYPFYGRAPINDFDRWASNGNPDWSYKEVLPYFKKLENYTISNDTKIHGHTGLIPVALVKPKTPVEDRYILGWNQLGINTSKDFHGSSSRVLTQEFTITNGQRSNAGYAYFIPIVKRTNFKPCFKCFVTKILIDSESKAAIGVKFVQNGKVYYANTRKEVIVAAGVVNTAQLLQLSGIGPRKDLEKLNIPVVASLPVGSLMNDFLIYDMFVVTDYKTKTDLNCLINDYLMGEGVLTTPLNYRQSIIVSEEASGTLSGIILWAPPTGLHDTVPLNSNTDSSANVRSFNFTNTFRFSLLYPAKSKGIVKLQSNNPVDFPIIDINLFDDPEDLQTPYHLAKIVESFLKTPAIRSDNPRIVTAYPEQNKYKVGSKDYWMEDFKLGIRPYARGAATTKMGPRTDPEAVVDSKLKVHNVPNLRVIGRSVLPFLVGFTEITGYMIGEKAADIIKKEYGWL